MAKKIIFILLSAFMLVSCCTTKFVKPNIRELNIERPERPEIPSYDVMMNMNQEVLVKKILVPLVKYGLEMESIADDYEKAYNSVRTEMNKK